MTYFVQAWLSDSTLVAHELCCLSLSAHHETVDARVLQDSKWVIQDTLGSGVSGTVHTCINPHYPNVVLKRGNLLRLRKEAGMMRLFSHPNVARVYAVLQTNEITELDGIMGYMALGRLGSSLNDMLQTPNK